MIPRHATVLDAKIAARNRVNKLAIATIPTMIAALQPFIGKKVLNVGPALCQRLKDALPKDNCGGKGASADQWYYSPSSNSLYACFSVSECAAAMKPDKWRSYPTDTWEQATTSALIAEFKDGVLIKAGCGQTWRTDYNREEVERDRAAYDTAKKAADEAESRLEHFGTWDRAY